MLLKEPDLRALSLTISTATEDRKSGSAGMPRPISYAVFCLKKNRNDTRSTRAGRAASTDRQRPGRLGAGGGGGGGVGVGGRPPAGRRGGGSREGRSFF